MFRQVVYRKVIGSGTTPTAGAFALVGLISPVDFDHRSQLQRLPLAAVGDVAMIRPPRIPSQADVIWVNRESRPDPAFFRFNQRAPLAQVGDAAARFSKALDLRAIVRSNPDPSYWFQRRAVAQADIIPPAATGGGLFGDRVVRSWVPISPVLHWRHRAQELEELIAIGLSLGLSQAEIATLIASAEDGDLIA